MKYLYIIIQKKSSTLKSYYSFTFFSNHPLSDVYCNEIFLFFFFVQKKTMNIVPIEIQFILMLRRYRSLYSFVLYQLMFSFYKFSIYRRLGNRCFFFENPFLSNTVLLNLKQDAKGDREFSSN